MASKIERDGPFMSAPRAFREGMEHARSLANERSEAPTSIERTPYGMDVAPQQSAKGTFDSLDSVRAALAVELSRDRPDRRRVAQLWAVELQHLAAIDADGAGKAAGRIREQRELLAWGAVVDATTTAASTEGDWLALLDGLDATPPDPGLPPDVRSQAGAGTPPIPSSGGPGSPSPPQAPITPPRKNRRRYDGLSGQLFVEEVLSGTPWQDACTRHGLPEREGRQWWSDVCNGRGPRGQRIPPELLTRIQAWVVERARRAL